MEVNLGYTRAVSYTVKKYINGVFDSEITYDFSSYYSPSIPAIVQPNSIMTMDENSYNARVIAVKTFIKENNYPDVDLPALGSTDMRREDTECNCSSGATTGYTNTFEYGCIIDPNCLSSVSGDCFTEYKRPVKLFVVKYENSKESLKRDYKIYDYKIGGVDAITEYDLLIMTDNAYANWFLAAIDYIRVSYPEINGFDLESYAVTKIKDAEGCPFCEKIETFEEIGCEIVSTGTTENTYNIGDKKEGGTIVYLNEDKTHGFAVSDDLGKTNWQNTYNTNRVGLYLSSDIYSGYTNTNAIVLKYGAAPTVYGDGLYAAKKCFDLNINGFDDWSLPSKDELNVIYQNRAYIGYYDTIIGYWSSTDATNIEAWEQNFGTGVQGTADRWSWQRRVFAIRYF